jgi:hypothetical protein
MVTGFVEGRHSLRRRGPTRFAIPDGAELGALRGALLDRERPLPRTDELRVRD